MALFRLEYNGILLQKEYTYEEMQAEMDNDPYSETSTFQTVTRCNFCNASIVVDLKKESFTCPRCRETRKVWDLQFLGGGGV